MGTERKSTMVSARLPTVLVERVDYVVRNSEPELVRNRSEAFHKALEAWLPNEEQRLIAAGVMNAPRKAR